MTPVKLPEEYKANTIREMPEGQPYYAVPWAMFEDNDGNLFLNGDYSYEDEMVGTSTMKITRLFGAYTVDISKCDHKWHRGLPVSIDGEWVPEIPVAGLIF